MVMTMIISTASASPCTAVAFRQGFLAALPFIVSNGIAGIAMGVAYRGLGLGFAPAGLFSLVVYSAPAQTVTLGLLALPPPIPAVAIAWVAANLQTQWRGWRSLLPWSASAAIGLTVASTLGQSWAMLIGGGVGTLVSALSGDDA